MVRLGRLEENRDRDALLSKSMMNEIARLTNTIQEYEARFSQLEIRDQQEPHAPLPHTPSSNEMKQRYYENNE